MFADVETIEKMALLEFKHGDTERGKTLFEGLVDKFPKRLDLWGVYIDQVAKVGDIQGVRGLVDRALEQKLTSKKAKWVPSDNINDCILMIVQVPV